MSKERKLRREARELAARQAQEAEARRATRRLARRELWRRITLYDLRRRSNGKLSVGQTRAQRAIVAVFVLVSLFAIWQLVPSVELAVVLTLVLLLTLPVFVLVAFDRRSS
ncbi:hypothetical protein [Catellatospora tritici]|uniref:hypothetical protein n=1 Tax=Catellatospora tritici TaxID=2851566 RepID=UPI001C2DC306|nr:hypothetical protein [Catellatospora tritici]MBV1852427.1 hypothetical protein [Catellatospora tritici]